jgi:hypothetical protein
MTTKTITNCNSQEVQPPSDVILEFGKYKRQPIEVLEHDEQYKEWVLNQPWFKDRYPKVYNVIINNFCEPSSTPEHNRMQARFLDEEYRVAFCHAANIYAFCGVFYLEGRYDEDQRALFHPREINCLEPVRNPPKVSFEVNGADVLIGGNLIRERKIEIKPVIADDYPQVLRQIKRSGCHYLLVGQYTGVGVDQKTFVKFFRNEGIKIIFEHEVDDELEKMKNPPQKNFSLLENL